MELLIYLLIGWGITDFLVNGSILDGIRIYLLVKYPTFGKLLSCIRCSGFWVGVLMGLISIKTMGGSIVPVEEIPTFQVIGSGFLISGSSIIINALMIFLLTRNLKNNNQTTDEE